MPRGQRKSIKSPNSVKDPRKSKQGFQRDGSGKVQGINRKGRAFIFDPSKHKRDPLTGKWVDKPDIVEPKTQKSSSKSTNKKSSNKNSPNLGEKFKKSKKST